MKKFLLLFLPFILAACSDADISDYPLTAPSEIQISNAIRSSDEAVEIARGIMIVNGASTDIISRSTSNPHCTVITDGKSARSVEDTLIYAISFDEGFVMVAAPNNVEPILAISSTGHFDDEITQNNEGFQSYVNMAKEYVKSNSLAGALDPILHPYSYKRVKNVTNQIEPRITVEWNQGWPENIFAPNKVAGCVPVAMAQILSHYELPTSIALTYENADKSNLRINWQLFKKHTKSSRYKNLSDKDISTHLSSCGQTDLETHLDLARFIRELGALSDASYGETSTDASQDSAYLWLSKFIPNHSFTTAGDLDRMFELLKKSGVAMMVGYKDKKSGHAWVVDGTLEIGTITYLYVIDDPTAATPTYHLESTTSDITNYIHINWGWSGNSNGYFLLGVFDTSDGYKYDNPDGNTASHNYNKFIEFFHIN